MNEFRGKVAVVTGGASGIGRGLAERFAEEGMKVVLADIEESALAQAAAELREKGAQVLAVRTDVSSGVDVETLAQKTLQEFGAVHVVCNNAGVTDVHSAPVWQRTEADWAWVLGVNLWGVIHGVRVFVPLMLDRGEEGHIVNTSSMAGLMAGPRLNTYGVTKHAVVALTESLYLELKAAAAKVSASVLCPGVVKTRIADADRNRPTRLTDPTRVSGPELEGMREIVRHQLADGLSPGVVADMVLRAIRDDRFYILTHPQMMSVVETRLRNIVEGNNPSATSYRNLLENRSR